MTAPRSSATPGGCGCVIYRWPAFADSLLGALLPQATLITARPNDTVEAVCAAIPARARVFIFHIDLTFSRRFPLCRDRLVETLRERGLVVLNSSVTDISKRTIQRHCADLGLHSVAAVRAGDPAEALIVKTNFNFGGWGERRLTRAERRLLEIGEIPREIRHELDYQILPRDAVPDAWWGHRYLAIERYIRNKRDCIYKLYFFLDRMAISEIIDHHVIKKAVGSAPRRNSLFRRDCNGVYTVRQAGDYPDTILQHGLKLAAHMGLDFGVLDLVHDDDDRVYIIDVNLTAGFPLRPQPGLGEHLREALNSDCATVPVRPPLVRGGWSKSFGHLFGTSST